MILNGVITQEDVSPSFEVKYLLDSDKVLNKDKQLKKQYKELFEVKTDPVKLSMIFMETPNKDFNAQGWINRIRVKQGHPSFRRTYKKRYAVENGDIDAALEKVKNDGFFMSLSAFSAEVDWGYSKMTLSLSCNVERSTEGYDEMELPATDAAIDMVKNAMPEIERSVMKEQLGKGMFKSLKKVGPVSFDRNVGSYKGTLVNIEVMPITNKAKGTTTYVTELSFRKYNFEDANSLREELAKYLDELGINVHEDSLKTQAVLDAYLTK